MKFALVFTIFLAWSAFEVSALRCYTCKGNNHEQCKHFRNLEVEECAMMNENEKSKDLKLMCSKIVMEEGKSYARGCVKVDSKNDYCENNTNHTKDAKCYFCDSNLCNGSGKSAAKLVALAFAVVFVLMF